MTTLEIPPVILTGGDLYAKLLTHHEMGHVIACLEYGIEFDKVVLETGWWTRFTGGYVATACDFQPEKMDEELIVYFAGRAAEERWLELRPGHGHARAADGYHDFQVARRLMREYETSSEGALRIKAAQLVERRWLQIEAGATLLEERKKMSAAAAKRATKGK